MDTTLDLLREAAEAARGMADRAMLPADLRLAILGLQSHLDSVRVAQSLLIAEAERTEAWSGTGARNMADWLSGATRSSFGEAKRKSKLGKALTESGKLKDAVDEGSVSPDAAEQLADAVSNPPANASEDDIDSLIDACKGSDVRDTRDAVNRFRDLFSGESDDEAAERRHQLRAVRASAECDGMVVTTVQLPTAQHDQFIKAVNHAAGPLDPNDQRTAVQRLADGLVNLATAYAAGEVTGGRQKPTMLIVWTAAGFRGETDDDAVTDLGHRIPAREARRLAEIADLRRVVTAGNAIIDMGRKVRCATDDQYQALVARDGGCGWPGCHAPAGWCEVDHIVEWDRGNGPSDLANLWLLCPHHHIERHRPGVLLQGDAHHLRIRLPDGRALDRQWRRSAAA